MILCYIFNYSSSGKYEFLYTKCRVKKQKERFSRTYLAEQEAEFMNIQFHWGLWAYSWDFQTWGFHVLYKVYITNQFQTIFAQGRGVKFVSRDDCEIERGQTLKTFVPITSKNSASVVLYYTVFLSTSQLFSEFLPACVFGKLSFWKRASTLLAAVFCIHYVPLNL